jgi:4-amino-4-deoxy-L-arabinose transferase-like glycosyltransferase
MTQPGSVPSRSVSPQALDWLLLLLIVCVGAFLRFHMLGVRSLWPPECFSFLVARQPFPLFLRTMWWGEANMAFYYLLLRGWALLGDSEVWLQSLSALFGVLAIPAVYALGKRFLSSKVGLIAAALLAVNSSHIGHSEQLRSYSLWVLLAVLTTYCFLALLESPQRKILWFLYILLAVLMIYTQVFGVFLLAAHWLAVAARIRTLGVWKILSTFAAIGILSAPMAVVMLTQNKGQLDWVPPVSLASFWEVFRNIVGTDVLGPHDIAATVALSILYVAAWIVAILGIFHAGGDQAGETRVTNPVTVLSWSLLFPLVNITALSFAKPVLYPRYLLICLPCSLVKGCSSSNNSYREDESFFPPPSWSCLLRHFSAPTGLTRNSATPATTGVACRTIFFSIRSLETRLSSTLLAGIGPGNIISGASAKLATTRLLLHRFSLYPLTAPASRIAPHPTAVFGLSCNRTCQPLRAMRTTRF